MANNALSYGFSTLKSLAAERVYKVGESVVLKAVQESAAYHSGVVSEILQNYAKMTTDFKVRYKTVGAGTLQPLTPDGNPLPVDEGGYYDVAFPIYHAGTAWAAGRVARQMMTVDEADRKTFEALRRDGDWIKRHFLAALFTNTTRTFADDQYGSITIQPLANADGTLFPLVGGGTSDVNHYLADANAISDSHNPFPTIYSTLTQHVANVGATVVVFVPTANVAAIQGLTSFVEYGDEDIVPGSNTSVISTNPMTVKGFGDNVLGKTDKCWVVEWKSLPDNYLIGFAVNANPDQKVLAYREYPADGLKGFFAENHSPDGNIFETRMLRMGGFGALNRVGAVVQRVGNGSYGIPTGYTAPQVV